MMRCRRLGSEGQATVEYLIVGLALMVVIVVLGLLAERLKDGVFVDRAIEKASHAVGGNAWETIGDVLLY
ncbi:MAG: hypothetical protein LBI64_05390 [Coriobacteriales bacterium]|jgi:ABC-type phosphate transport system permease subunit|nr:hypothetical protein [Coriobacteriales bacterium]